VASNGSAGDSDEGRKEAKPIIHSKAHLREEVFEAQSAAHKNPGDNAESGGNIVDMLGLIANGSITECFGCIFGR